MANGGDKDSGFPYLLQLEPHYERWRELMLDLGCPVDLVKWQIWVWVDADRLRDDLPYDLSETVSIQDVTGEGLGNLEVSKADLELFDPNYVSRTRIFLYDRLPARDELPPISPMFPSMPFIEIKHHRIIQWNPGDPPPGSLAFHFQSVPVEKREAEFKRHMTWWEGLKAHVKGESSGPAAGEGDGLQAVIARRRRIPRFPKSAYLAEGLAAAEALARSGETELTYSNLARQMGKDRETISTCAASYPDEHEQIQKKFSDTKIWLSRMPKKP